MNDFLVPMALSIIFDVIDQSIKNAKTRARYEKALRKLRQKIDSILPESLEADSRAVRESED